MDPIELISAGEVVRIRRSNGEVQAATIGIINKLDDQVTVYFIDISGRQCTKSLRTKELIEQNTDYYGVKKQAMSKVLSELYNANGDPRETQYLT